MMIQLKTTEGEILYELEKSDLFQDYRSVLIEAIALRINLENLCVNSEAIDNIDWTGAQTKYISFINCSMINNRFINCNIALYFDHCNAERLKIKNSIIEQIVSMDCNFNSTHIYNSSIKTALFLNNNLSDAIFSGCKIESTSYNSSNLHNSTFYQCTLNIMLIHKDTENYWYKNIVFNSCMFNNFHWTDITSITDISEIYLWNIADLNTLRYLTDQRFTTFENSETKLLYGIDAKTIWWQPHVNETLKSHKPLRFGIDDFFNEIYNNFPTSEIYPEMEDYEIENELLAFCEYIKIMHNNLL